MTRLFVAVSLIFKNLVSFIAFILKKEKGEKQKRK